MASRQRRSAGLWILAASLGVGLLTVMFVVVLAAAAAQSNAAACSTAENVGATEYGGPGDPASGHVGSSGVNLNTSPDSFAELGGTSFKTANALGGLPYGTPLMIAFRRRAVIAYKRDIGLGGGPIDGHPRVIDLWWKLAEQLGIPYDDGRWSGLVRVTEVGDGCLGTAADPLTAGSRARILSGEHAAIPRDAPAAVKGIIAAGNQIVGKPYLYGGGHGIPLNQIAASYDCSSSVSHLLWGGGLLSAGQDMTSGEFMNWGKPGPGKWVTIWASPDHVFMYVAGVRWDTHNAAGVGDGPVGIGWHPLVREHQGFVERHPAGL